MRDVEQLSAAELGALIQRLYLRLEQYEVHVGSLLEGSHQQEGAREIAEKMRRKVAAVAALLDRRIAESIGQDDTHARAWNLQPRRERTS